MDEINFYEVEPGLLYIKLYSQYSRSGRNNKYVISWKYSKAILFWFYSASYYTYEKRELESFRGFRAIEMHEFIGLDKIIELLEFKDVSVRNHYIDLMCMHDYFTYYLGIYKDDSRIEYIKELIEKRSNELIIKSIIE